MRETNEFAESVAKSLRAASIESGVDASAARLLIALSGGPDSTALLLALKNALAEVELNACHINHGLRGTESDGDEEFCQRVCRKLGVPLHVARLELGRSRPSEEDLRDARYAHLARVAQGLGADHIVTAHTADDQIETMLFRLFRGTAPQGFLGISPIRDMKSNPGLTIVRPMLKKTRGECLQYLVQQGVQAREDSSNADLSYTRNYIRRVMVPLIGDRFPGFQNRLEQFRTLLEADDALLSQLAHEHAEEVFGTDNDSLRLETLEQLPESLRRRMLEMSLESHDVEVSFERIQRIEQLFAAPSPKGGLSLNRRWDLRVDGDRIVWVDKEEAAYNRKRKERLLLFSTEINLPDSGSSTNIVGWLNKTLRVETWSESHKPALPAASSLEAYMDLSKIEGKLEVRPRRAGDLIQPLGMQNQVRLKKFIHTHKKDSHAVFDAAGTNVVLAQGREVLWVVGVGLSERIKVFDRPTHRLTWLDLAPNVTIA